MRKAADQSNEFQISVSTYVGIGQYGNPKYLWFLVSADMKKAYWSYPQHNVDPDDLDEVQYVLTFQVWWPLFSMISI